MELFDYTFLRGARVLVPDLDMSVVDNSERRRRAEARGRALGVEVGHLAT